MKITLYSTTTCPYCKMLKKYFTEKQVVFEEKLTDLDEKVQAEMMAQSNGFLGVPFTVVSKADGSVEKIIGFDRAKIDSIVGIV